MTKFGTSAYIKLLALNPVPRDTLIRGRLSPTRSGGYDFHKAMRKIVPRAAAGIISPTEARRLFLQITKASERAYAEDALSSLVRWLDGRQITLPSETKMWRSPRDLFSVEFTPDFEVEHEGAGTKFHLWDTRSPICTQREAIGALGLFVSDEAPLSIGVLSLQTDEAFVPRNAGEAHRLAMLLAADIERRFEKQSTSVEGRKDVSDEVRPAIH